METTTILMGTLHGWIGAIWISVFMWKQNKRVLSILCALIPFVAFISGIVNFKILWKPTLMIIVGLVIVILA